MWRAGYGRRRCDHDDCGKQQLRDGAVQAGIVVVLASALFWALLGALIRKWIGSVSTSFALSSVFTIVTMLFSRPIWYMAASHAPRPGVIWAFLAVSGLIGLGIGHSLYYRSIAVLGIALSSSLALLIPLLVGVASFFLFRERLTGSS